MNKSPDAFRTISEVADWLETPAHVLRFWESKFAQIKPVKRAGGRRYYRPSDMMLLGGLKRLLHEDGMTIKGAQALLREQGVKHVAALSPPVDDFDEPAPPPAPPEPVAIEPAEDRGLPPAGLPVEDLKDEAEDPPAREWDLIENPEVVDLSDVAAEAEDDEAALLPFIHRAPSPNPPGEHFLSAAGHSIDDRSTIEVPPEPAPAPPPPEPAGPLRLDALRQALMAPGRFDREVLVGLRERLAGLRNRMAQDAGSGRG